MTPEEIRQTSDTAMRTAGRVISLMMDDRNEGAYDVARQIIDPLEQVFVVLYAASLAGALAMIEAESRGVDRDEHLAFLLDSLKESMPEYGGSA